MKWKNVERALDNSRHIWHTPGMRIIATPYCMTTAYFEKAVRNGFGLLIPVGIREDYTARSSGVYYEDDAETVLSKVWERFQNIEPPHVCPDGGRSMMVGDLIRLEYDDGSTGFFMVAALGFTSVDADWMHA